MLETRLDLKCNRIMFIEIRYHLKRKTAHFKGKLQYLRLQALLLKSIILYVDYNDLDKNMDTSKIIATNCSSGSSQLTFIHGYGRQ